MKTFRKRLISLLLVFILLISYCSLLASCGDGYTIVYAIEYSVDGVVKTEYSSVEPIFEYVGKMNINDYSADLHGYHVGYLLEGITLTQSSSTVDSVGQYSDENIGCDVYINDAAHASSEDSRNGDIIEHYIYKGLKYHYIKVKEKGDNVIAIKNADGLSEYMVDYYKVVYFDDIPE